MGGGYWDPTAYNSYASTVASKPQAAIFKSRSLNNALDPTQFKVRESKDSADHPESTPIMILADETGSMGYLAEQIIKKDLGVIMAEIYDRKPVPDPHLLAGGVGDAYSDSAPIQVTQFEADIRITDQIADIFIEGNGGGNGGESYIAAWYFAAYKTDTDSFTKRGRKGYIFTIGDEAPHLTLTKDQIKRFFGDNVERDYKASDLLDVVRQSWNVFHLIVKPEGRFTHQPDSWKNLLGENAIVVEDDTKIGEVIVSTIQVIEGASVDDVVSSWSGSTALVVRDAIKDLAKADGDLVAL